MQHRLTKISTKSGPITMHLPVKKTLCFMHRPCQNTIKMQPKYLQIFFALHYEVPTLKWRKKSSSKKSECMKTTQAGWFLTMPASCFLQTTHWAIVYSEQLKASPILNATKCWIIFNAGTSLLISPWWLRAILSGINS